MRSSSNFNVKPPSFQSIIPRSYALHIRWKFLMKYKTQMPFFLASLLAIGGCNKAGDDERKAVVNLKYSSNSEAREASERLGQGVTVGSFQEGDFHGLAVKVGDYIGIQPHHLNNHEGDGILVWHQRDEDVFEKGRLPLNATAFRLSRGLEGEKTYVTVSSIKWHQAPAIER